MISNPIPSIIAGTVLLLAVLAGVFVLAWHGTISGGEAMTVVISIVSLAGGILAVHSGVSAGGKASSRGAAAAPVKEKLPE